MTSNPIVRELTFTGSTEIGTYLMAQCAPTVKKVSLELGGNAPFIVFDDADLDAAVARRDGVEVPQYGPDLRLREPHPGAGRRLRQRSPRSSPNAVSKLKVGNGVDDGVTQGPLINEAAVVKVRGAYRRRRRQGRANRCRRQAHALGGNFFEPTLIARRDAGMAIAREETFGPVAPLFRFKTEEDAIGMANAHRVRARVPISIPATSAASGAWPKELEYGMVGINEGIISTEIAPFGGVKESGLGREGSHHGVEEYLEMKYMLMGGLAK